jgi:hypothetical protein
MHEGLQLLTLATVGHENIDELNDLVDNQLQHIYTFAGRPPIWSRVN